MKLIKFQSNTNFALEGIINNTLFFNNLDKLNDPFEGVIRYSLIPNNEQRKVFLETYFSELKKPLNDDEFLELINRNLEWRTKNNAVSCFSDYSLHKDMLMWANYAGDHTGYCLVFKNLTFKSKLENDTLLSAPNGPHKINYVENLILLNPIEDQNNNQFILTKHSAWCSEREYRFIAPKIGTYTYKIENIVEIIFGLRTPFQTKVAIDKILKSNNHQVIMKQIIKRKKGFGFDTEVLEIDDSNTLQKIFPKK